MLTPTAPTEPPAEALVPGHRMDDASPNPLPPPVLPGDGLPIGGGMFGARIGASTVAPFATDDFPKGGGDWPPPRGSEGT